MLDQPLFMHYCFTIGSGVADGKEEGPEGSEQQEEEHKEQGLSPTQDGKEVQPTVSGQRPRPETLHHYGETPRGTPDPTPPIVIGHLYNATQRPRLVRGSFHASLYGVNMSFVHPSVHSYIHPSSRSFNHSFIHPPINPFVHPFIHPPVHPSIHLPVHPFIHPSIHSSIHLFTHRFIHRYLPTSVARTVSSKSCPPGLSTIWNRNHRRASLVS